MFVNRVLRSVYFWAVVCGLVLLLWLVKFDFSKFVKIIKLLGEMVSKLFTLVLYLFAFPFVKLFNEAEASVE